MHKNSGKPLTLLILLAEPISGWVAKGEIIPNYLNPGNVFEKIIIFTLTDDVVEDSIMSLLVGRATYSVQTFPAGKALFLRTLGWRSHLLKRWIDPMLESARNISPDLIRCYSAHLNIEIGRRIKDHLQVPLVVSLHSLPEESLFVHPRFQKNAVANLALRRIRRFGLRAADVILPVYSSIVPYLERMNLSNFRVAYNMTNPTTINSKLTYNLSSPINVIWTGREIDGKDPTNIVKAILTLEGFHLTLIGMGEKHQKIRDLITQRQDSSKFTLIKSMDNGRLCRMLSECDIFVANCNLPGIPKTVIEALLTGAPVLINRNTKYFVAEINDKNSFQVEDSVAGYRSGFHKLSTNDQLRARTGNSGRVYAEQLFSPLQTEKVFADTYLSLLIS